MKQNVTAVHFKKRHALCNIVQNSFRFLKCTVTFFFIWKSLIPKWVPAGYYSGKQSCIIGLLAMEFLFDRWFFFEKKICLTLCFSLIFILHLYLKYGCTIYFIDQSIVKFMNCFIKFARQYIIRSQRFINMMCKIKNIITNTSSSL
jgi:hypothetical protein